MEAQMYEFMQTKLFGLIFALVGLVFVCFAFYHFGYWKGQIDQKSKQEAVFFVVSHTGEVFYILNGKAQKVENMVEEKDVE